MKKREQLRQKLQRQQAILAAARTAGRDMTEDETREFNSLQNDIETLRPEADAEAEAERQAQIEAARTAERQRVTDITTLCRNFNVDASQYITGGQTVDQVRTAILDGMIQNGTPARTGVKVTADETDKFRAAAADGLMTRSGHAPAAPADGSRQFAGMSLRDIGIECLTRETGKSASDFMRMSADDLYTELARAFHNPSASFPAIMDTAINKSIVHAYDHAPTTFEKFTRKGTLRDFKRTDGHNYLIGGVGDLLLVPENGELKADTHKEEMLPQRKLDTYGRQFSMSRQAFINDDIGFIATVPGRFAQAAKRTINKQCYQLLYNNAAVFDGKAFFSADHKNLLTTGTGMTSAAIKEMRQKLRTQTDQFGEAITLTPNFLILPVSEQYDNDLVSIFMSPTIQTTENTQAANPLYRQNYDIIEDNTLNVLAGSNACPWFMGDKGVPCVKVDYLNGNETPNVRRSEKARTLGFIWDFWLDWGITATDFRSMVKNPGVAL